MSDELANRPPHMPVYGSKLAEKLKKRPGQKWEPDDVIERDTFTQLWCGTCKQGKSVYIGGDECPIMAASRLPIEHPDYPAQWQINKDGVPICTAYEKLYEVRGLNH